jgi:hypothetical protein
VQKDDKGKKANFQHSWPKESDKFRQESSCGETKRKAREVKERGRKRGTPRQERTGDARVHVERRERNCNKGGRSGGRV